MSPYVSRSYVAFATSIQLLFVIAAIFGVHQLNAQSDDNLDSNGTYTLGNASKWRVRKAEASLPVRTVVVGGRLLIGRYASDTLTLTLPRLPAADMAHLTLHVHIIGSWDGNVDDDRLAIEFDGREIFSETFSNTLARQSFPPTSSTRSKRQRTGAWSKNTLPFRYSESGIYDGPLDAMYHLLFNRPVENDSIRLRVWAKLRDVRRGIDNESWAIGYVRLQQYRSGRLSVVAEAETYKSHETVYEDASDAIAGRPPQISQEFPGLLPWWKLLMPWWSDTFMTNNAADVVPGPVRPMPLWSK